MYLEAENNTDHRFEENSFDMVFYSQAAIMYLPEEEIDELIREVGSVAKESASILLRGPEKVEEPF